MNKGQDTVQLPMKVHTEVRGANNTSMVGSARSCKCV